VKKVYVSTFQDEALVVRSLLESGGIACQMLADRMMDTNPLFSTDINGVQILVSDEHEEDAKALVADFIGRRRVNKT